MEIGISGKHGKAGDMNDSVYKNVGATAYAIDWNYVKPISAIKSIIGFRGQFTSLTVDKANYYLDDSTTYTFDNTMQSFFTQFSFRPAMLDNKFLKNIEFLARWNALTAPKNAVWNPGKDNNGQGGTITRLDLGLDYWLTWRTALRFAYESTKKPDGTKTDMFLIRFATGF